MILNADIPSNLTFGQFKALAMREPDVAGNWLYSPDSPIENYYHE